MLWERRHLFNICTILPNIDQPTLLTKKACGIPSGWGKTTLRPWVCSNLQPVRMHHMLNLSVSHNDKRILWVQMVPEHYRNIIICSLYHLSAFPEHFMEICSELFTLLCQQTNTEVMISTHNDIKGRFWKSPLDQNTTNPTDRGDLSTSGQDERVKNKKINWNHV